MRRTIGNIEFYGGIKRVGYVNGVNSAVGDDKHFLMWDFDQEDVSLVMMALSLISARYKLGSIYVLDTNKVFKGLAPTIKNLHAYCFSPFPWREAFNIVWDTPFLCGTFLKMAFVRGFFTLRFSDKAGRDSSLYAILEAPPRPDDIDPKTIGNFVRYLTKVK